MIVFIIDIQSLVASNYFLNTRTSLHILCALDRTLRVLLRVRVHIEAEPGYTYAILLFTFVLFYVIVFYQASQYDFQICCCDRDRDSLC